MFNLMLFDINMPQMTGFELEYKVREILNEEDDGETKIAAVTAQENLKDDPNYETHQFDMIIKKPVTKDDLMAVLNM